MLVKFLLTLLFLYCMYVVYFFIGDNRRKKRRKNIIGSGSELSAMNRRKENIVGKSTFELKPLTQFATKPEPLATTSPESGKAMENPDTFVPSNDRRTAAEVPPEEMDEAFSETPPEEGNEPMDIDVPLEYDDNKQEENPEPEEEEVEGAAQAMLASGVKFEYLSSMVWNVDHPDDISPEAKNQAGETLLEIRQTDMFEQLVSGKPGRANIVTEFMDAHLSAFYRRLDERNTETSTHSNNEKKVPADFDIRNFA